MNEGGVINQCDMKLLLLTHSSLKINKCHWKKVIYLKELLLRYSLKNYC